MRRAYKILLVLLGLFLLLQIPFIYRRYQLGAAFDRIRSTQNSRPSMRPDGLNEYKGVIHVHSTNRGELSDAFNEMLYAACDTRLDFVILTEHYSTAYDTSAKTLSGYYGPTLYVAGNEINTRQDDRFLMLPGGSDAAEFRLMATKPTLDRVHGERRLAILAYPEKYSSGEADIDGIEVFNLASTIREINPVAAALDVPWSFSSYPALSIARVLKRPDANLRMFDERSQQKKLSLIAGLDAHSAIGFHVLGDELGNHLLGLKIDDYKTVFGIARLHVLTSSKQLAEADLLDLIRRGRFFVGFDVLGDTDGFSFEVTGSAPSAGIGDELPFAQDLWIEASAPAAARFCLFRNGEKISESIDASMKVKLTSPGVYRVEVYRTDLGSAFSEVPWILSNPIYIK